MKPQHAFNKLYKFPTGTTGRELKKHRHVYVATLQLRQASFNMKTI